MSERRYNVVTGGCPYLMVGGLKLEFGRAGGIAEAECNAVGFRHPMKNWLGVPGDAQIDEVLSALATHLCLIHDVAHIALSAIDEMLPLAGDYLVTQ